MSDENGKPQRDRWGRFLPGNQLAKGHAFRPHWGHRYRETHGLSAARRRLVEFGSRAIDRRSDVGKALIAWKVALVADLGGEDNISIQQRQIIDLCCRTKLLLDSLDAWLLKQESLVRSEKGSVLPVVLERQKLADSLAKHLSMLGLERKKEEIDLAAEWAKEKRERERKGEE